MNLVSMTLYTSHINDVSQCDFIARGYLGSDFSLTISYDDVNLHCVEVFSRLSEEIIWKFCVDSKYLVHVNSYNNYFYYQLYLVDNTERAGFEQLSNLL